jgi:rod shape-determining protein MreC
MSIWRNRPLMITIIVVIILLVLLIMTAGENNISGTESIIGSILSPVQSGLYSATNAISDFFSRIFSGADLQSENQKLQEEVAQLKSQLQDYDEVKAENERLAALLNFDTKTADLEYVTARVIYKAPGHWFNVFVINVGMASGIEANMPVVNGDGLVGKVVDVGANWSRIMTIVDSESGVSAIVERTRDTGVLTGTISTGSEASATLTMSYLPLDADLVPGDTVITSGLDGVFPKGIPVGEVTEVSSAVGGTQNQTVVTPWVDFYHLEEVMVITSKNTDIQEALQ